MRVPVCVPMHVLVRVPVCVPMRVLVRVPVCVPMLVAPFAMAVLPGCRAGE